MLGDFLNKLTQKFQSPTTESAQTLAKKSTPIDSNYFTSNSTSQNAKQKIKTDNVETQEIKKALNEAEDASEICHTLADFYPYPSNFSLDDKYENILDGNSSYGKIISDMQIGKRAPESVKTALDIVSKAEEYIGYNESDNSADIFVPGGDSSEVAWCGLFVKYVLENCGGYENINQWYKSVENQKWTPSILKKAEAAKQVYNISKARPGDLIMYLEPDGSARHVGIFNSAEQKADGSWTVNSIEGNEGNQVAEVIRDHPADTTEIVFLRVT